MQEIQKNYLTKEGYDNALDELHDLQKNKLPNILERLKEAISQGDISENAEYDTAMMEREFVEKRILELSDLLKNVEIIDEKSSKGPKEVRYGSKVQLRHMEKNKKMTLMTENGEIDTFTIVGPGEVNNETGHISFDSPIGMAIKGKKLNEICRVKLDHARFEIKILDVK